MISVRDLLLNLREQRSGHALLETSRDLDKLGQSADRFGDKTKALRRETQALDKQIASVNAKIRDLSVQFAHTGDRSLFGDIRKEKTFLGQLQKIRAELEKIDKTGGVGVALSLPGGGVGGVPAPLIAGAVGLAALMAPPIGAAVGGAVLGAVGTGGMIGGIAAASKDPGVRAAARDFGASITAEFFSSGKAFVEPVKSSLGILSAEFQHLHLGEAFAKAVPAVSMLTKGIVGFAESAMPGVNKALAASIPIAKVLADELPQVGDAFSDMLSDISASKGVIGGFHYALDTLEAVLRGTGDTVNWLGNRFEDMVRFQAAATGNLEDIFGWVPWVGDRIRQANDHAEDWIASMDQIPDAVKPAAVATGDFASYLADAEAAARGLNVQLDDLFGKALGVDESFLAMKKSVLDLTDALGKDRGAWNADTEAGLNHQKAVLDAIESAQRWRDALVKNGMSTDEANRKYDQQYEAIMRLAMAAGITRQEFERLAGKYEIAVTYTSFVVNAPPRMRSDNLYALTGEIARGGPAPPLSGLTGPQRNVHSRQQIPGLASGGTAVRGGFVDVGEFGRERMYMPAGASVVPLGAGGGPTVTVSFAATGDPFLDALIRELRKFVRIEGGTGSGSVQAALGHGQ